MSEGEVIEAFRDYALMVDSLLFGYVGVLTAFLVMSYFTAHKLTKFLSVIVLGLYTLTCGMLITRLTFVRNDLQALHAFILEQQATNELYAPWFGTNPSWGPVLVTWLIWAVTAGGFFASVGFFLVRRRQTEGDA